jgi:hypothetical protein
VERERRREPAECSWHARAPNRVTELTSEELEEELTIAAWAPGRQRLERYERLLAERRRRLLAA